MSYDISLLTAGSEGSFGTLYCNSIVVSGGWLAYGLLIIVAVAIFWAMMKRNYSIYTAFPVTLFPTALLSLMFYSLKCATGTPIDGRLVVLLFGLAGLALGLRKILES